jgi:hypothetical protein
MKSQRLGVWNVGEEEKVNLLDYLKGFLEIREIMGTESKELQKTGRKAQTVRGRPFYADLWGIRADKV